MGANVDYISLFLLRTGSYSNKLDVLCLLYVSRINASAVYEGLCSQGILFANTSKAYRQNSNFVRCQILEVGSLPRT
jgi:hypothetical protein